MNIQTQVITEITRTETITVTAEMVQALRTVRNQPGRTSEEALQLIVSALDVLDNAGVFAAIDEATGYDTDPAPERVLKPCGCVNIKQKLGPADSHIQGCKSDPAEYGDMAYVDGPTRPDTSTIQCSHCRGDFAPKMDGSIRRHKCQAYRNGSWTYGPLHKI